MSLLRGLQAGITPILGTLQQRAEDQRQQTLLQQARDAERQRRLRGNQAGVSVLRAAGIALPTLADDQLADADLGQVVTPLLQQRQEQARGLLEEARATRDQTFRAQEAERDRQARAAEGRAQRGTTLEAARIAAAASAQRAAAARENPKPTEQQQRFGLIAPQLRAADSTITALEQQAPTFWEQNLGRVPLLGNLFKSDRQQQIDQASDMFAQHYLWGLSGASAPDAETERVSGAVRSRMGDKDPVRLQKASTRGLMRSGAELIARGGRPPAGAADAPAAQPVPTRRVVTADQAAYLRATGAWDPNRYEVR